jgi:hypothetical protein
VCLKERNMLLSDRLYFQQVGQSAPDGSRLQVRPGIQKFNCRCGTSCARDSKPRGQLSGRAGEQQTPAAL